MQNPTVQKDLTLVVVDAWRGFGNGCVIPAGPLREPVTKGMARGDVLISIGDARAQTRFEANWGRSVSISHLKAELQPLQMGFEWDGQNVLAFAGIGHPEKFFQTLTGLGANLLRAEALRDHQPLSTSLMTRLEIDALALDAQLVTTEKDAVRLPRAFRTKVITLPVRLEIPDWGEIDQHLARLGLD